MLEENPLAQFQMHLGSIIFCFFGALCAWHFFLFQWKVAQTRIGLLIIDYVWLFSAVTSATIGAFHFYYNGLQGQARTELRYFETYLTQNIVLTQTASLWCESGSIGVNEPTSKQLASVGERKLTMFLSEFCEKLPGYVLALDEAREEVQGNILSVSRIANAIGKLDLHPIGEQCLGDNGFIVQDDKMYEAMTPFFGRLVGTFENICHAHFLSKLYLRHRIEEVFKPIEWAERYVPLLSYWVYLLVIAAALRITRTSIELHQSRSRSDVKDRVK